MESQEPPELLAEVAGRALYRRGSQIWLMESGAGWIPTTTFVLALVFVILGINGLVQVVLALGGGGSLGLGLAAMGIAGVVGFALVKVRRVARSKRGFAGAELVLIFDLESQQLCNRDKAVIAPLSQVSVHTAMQLTSSSRQLMLSWPEGKLCIARGSPFAGDVSSFGDVFRAAGLRVG